MVRGLARRFARPGVPEDDLAQAGWIALIGAVDRYDPDRQVQFNTYAHECVKGEMRRYFRDRTWALKVPRHLKEVAANLSRVQDRLLTRLNREPTPAEMAEEFGVSEEDLLAAMELRGAYHLKSLEQRGEGDDGRCRSAVNEMVGRADRKMENLVRYSALHEVLQQLEPREKTILRLRFWEEKSQAETGVKLGLSQMHVSRLERKLLRKLESVLAATPL